MLKDNHVWSCGSITAAIKQARLAGGFSLLLDVEVRDEAEADEAIDAGADIYPGHNSRKTSVLLPSGYTPYACPVFMPHPHNISSALDLTRIYPDDSNNATSITPHCLSTMPNHS